MDISLRMWLFIILGVLILGILIDGIRRWVREKNNPYKIAIGAIKIDPAADDPFRHEFGGPPRPVDPSKLEAKVEPFLNDGEVTSLQTEIETVETEHVSEPKKTAKKESFFERHTKSKVTEPKIEDEKPVKPKKKKSKPEQLDLTSVPMLIDPVVIAEDTDDVDEINNEEAAQQPDAVENVALNEASVTQADEEEEIQEAIVLNVFSRDAKGFQGEPLLEVLLGCSLRYGDMSIFHRHQSPVGEGKVLFSVANAMNPGTFKIEAMNKFSTKGLSFFFGLPGPNKPIETFDLMLQTAQYLAKRLNGELKDDKRNVLTAQTIEHYRQRIRDFERRHLVQ